MRARHFLQETLMIVVLPVACLQASHSAYAFSRCESLLDRAMEAQNKYMKFSNPNGLYGYDPQRAKENIIKDYREWPGETLPQRSERIKMAEDHLKGWQKISSSATDRLTILQSAEQILRYEYGLCVLRSRTEGPPAKEERATIPSETLSKDSANPNLDTPERLQAAQANQQQADRAFAGKKRAHDDNANTEQPIPGPSEGKTTNRGPVRVNVAYCFDSHRRAYSGSLKCSTQRFGYTSVEAGQTVELLPPSSGLQALTFACKHPTKPYDVEFVNDGLSGRCAAY